MTPPMTPREKVAAAIERFAAEMGDIVGNEIGYADAILTALASGSGSGDHAELARLAAEANQPMPAKRRAGWWRRKALFEAAFTPSVCSALLAENAALLDREKAALKECSEWARQAGEAIGKLETSEAAGIVEGWRDRATEAERKLAEAVGLLEPFAKLADEEGGYREDDRLAWGLNTADINWGDLRAARYFISKEAER